jgi:hypothetical protein
LRPSSKESLSPLSSFEAISFRSGSIEKFICL